jgi:hypothetical protein
MHNRFKRLARALAAGAILLLGSLNTFAAEIDDIFGTWTGSWTFTSIGGDFEHPVPTSPEFTRNASFELFSFNELTGLYGHVFVDGAAVGDVSFLSVIDNKVSMQVTHPSTGWPGPSAFFLGTLGDHTLTGDYDVRGDLFGSQRWRGTMSLASAVPEPATAGLMALGLVALAWQSRRRRS